RVNFLIREAEVEVNNVVGENKYFVLCDSDLVKVDEVKRVVDIYFEWRALTDEEERKFGKRNIQDLLVLDAVDRIFSETSGSSVGSLLRVKENGEKTVLEKHLNNYVRRNTTDYFIHKNLKTFLERELEFYIKNEVVDLDELENLDERSLRIARAKVKAIREISRKIIEFLAQIEDFQKMLFEKKKFIIGTEYVITLDKIKEYAGEEFLESIAEEILKNTKQLEEWKELLGTDVKNKKDLVERQTFDGKEWKKLPLDTKHFGISFKIRLLEALSERNDLDEILDGILIKSENWQALNLLCSKFNEKIQCIYIDPPFNTGTNEFLYKNNYLDSSWLSMLCDRLELGKKSLKNDGSIYVRIDYHGSHFVRILLDLVFGRNNFANEIVINRTLAKQQMEKPFTQQTENLYFYFKQEDYLFNQIQIAKEPEWHPLLHFPRADERPRVVLGREFYPPKGRRWALSQDTINEYERKGKIRINYELTYTDCRGNLIKGAPELLYDTKLLRNDW
ncbi:MAG: DNA methyltransferase, partial [Candidatus Bathyarchaeia archaeon]